MLMTSSSPRGRSEAGKSIDGAKSDGEDDFQEGDAGRIKFHRLKKEVQDLRTQVRHSVIADSGGVLVLNVEMLASLKITAFSSMIWKLYGWQVQKLRDDLQLEKRRSRSMERSKNMAVKTIKESIEHGNLEVRRRAH